MNPAWHPAALAFLLSGQALAAVAPAPSAAFLELKNAAPKPIEAAPAPDGGPAKDLKGRRSASWSQGSFQSADGAPIFYKSRYPQRDTGAIPTVFVGGLTFAESFENLFGQEPASPQFFLWFRGHSPSPWTYTRSVVDADASDLAAMITTAAEATGARGVNLVLHSYSTLVFQRMVQLEGRSQVRSALMLLRNGRVVLINAMTHFKGLEATAGQQNAQAAQAIRGFVDWLDMMDIWAESVRRAAELNPLLAPQAAVTLAGWQVQRDAALALWTKNAADLTKEHLKDPWGPGLDPARQALLRQMERDAKDPGWQEGVIRRSNETSRMEVTKADIDRMRSYGLHVDIIHSLRDQLIPWASQKLFLELLGVRAPEEAPPAGTVLPDGSGLIRFIIVDADHYFPLKDPAGLAKLLP